MYGFLIRPRWLGFHLLVVAAIAAMISFGLWQLDRLSDRRDFNAQVEARIDLPAAPVGAVLPFGTMLEPADVEWRTVVATGTYLPDERFLVINRSQNGRAGDNVAVPMVLDDGRTLIVNRGFVPLGFEIPEPPTGTVAVRGVIRPSQQRGTGQLSDPAQGVLTEVQRLDVARIAPQLTGDVLPVYVDLLESTPAETPGLPEPVVRPDLSDGPHLSYAVQWFIFAAAVGAGWVLAVRRSVTSQRIDARGDADHLPSADDEPSTALARTPDA
jgi:cytochrome oxidase assembly protein ShyY1